MQIPIVLPLQIWLASGVADEGQTGGTEKPNKPKKRLFRFG
jgi:hypothetical protein